MLRWVAWASVLFSLLCTSVVLAAPTKVSLVYEVTRKGQPFATITETFTQTGEQYKIESVTKGIGVYALLGVRKMLSAGNITAQGLQPTHFELHQGDQAKKSVFADFDYVNNSVTLQAKGKQKVEPLLPQTQDLASLMYQWMFVPPQSDAVEVALTTGKKIRQYRYQVVVKDIVLNTAAGEFNTIQLENSEQNDENKTFWLAKNKHYIVVKMRMLDENGVQVEQVLKQVHVN
jgi:hypothetical protein